MLRNTKLHILFGTGGFDIDLITGGIYNFHEKSKHNQSRKQKQKQKQKMPMNFGPVDNIRFSV